MCVLEQLETILPSRTVYRYPIAAKSGTRGEGRPCKERQLSCVGQSYVGCQIESFTGIIPLPVETLSTISGLRPPCPLFQCQIKVMKNKIQDLSTTVETPRIDQSVTSGDLLVSLLPTG
ncbi:hypothetical protein J6590_066203 [Homalodisca vitripennis]|nr:hypothetical protein J6590_066203 [Homalodisca vitripennis]